jgi:hypothetical protein
MAYATTTQLQAYLGTASLPADAQRLLNRASDLVDFVTLGRIETTDTEQMLAARNATCAQVEYWITMGEDTDISGASYESISIGTFQMTTSSSESSKTKSLGSKHGLAPRAGRILFLAGMTYRGVRMI